MSLRIGRGVSSRVDFRLSRLLTSFLIFNKHERRTLRLVVRTLVPIVQGNSGRSVTGQFAISQCYSVFKVTVCKPVITQRVIAKVYVVE